MNSLFKVLFNFPSRYLSTIGLVAVFSLRWSLPPASGCTLKQPDSKARSDPGTLRRPLLAWHHLRAMAPFKGDLDRRVRPGNEAGPYATTPIRAAAQSARRDSAMGSSLFARRYWGNHGCFLFLRLLICLNPAGSPA